MKKSSLVALLGGALSLASLVGCGSKSDDGSIKVLFWHTFGDKQEAALVKKANSFAQLVQQNENVTVKVELSHLGGYNDVNRIVGTALRGGNGPTMTIAYPDSVASLAAMETVPGQYVVNIGEYFNNEEIGFGTDAYLGDTRKGTSDFVQSYIEEGQTFEFEGTYTMPYMKSSEVMLYNKTAVLAVMKFYKPSLSEPEAIDFVEHMSFQELMELAQCFLDHKEDLGFGSMNQPVFYDSDSNMVISHIEQLGLKYSYRDANNKVVLGIDKEADPTNAAEIEKLLGKYADWHAKNLITTKQTEGTYASDAFKNQVCFFTIGSSGGAGYSFPQSGGFDLGICRVPYMSETYEEAKFISQGPSIAFLNDKSLSSEANSLRLKYAWKFYKYITNTANNVELCVNGSEGYVPVRNSCYSSEIWSEFLETGDNYSVAAKVVKNDIDGHFLSSLVFNGSAEYRNQMTGLIGNVMKGLDIVSSMATATNNTKNVMK